MPVTRGLAGPDARRPARGAAWVGLLRWLNFSAYWLRIGQNHFELMELSAAKPVCTSARAPFSTERLLVGEFSLASRTLTPLVKSLHRRMLGFVLVIEPCALHEGGLCEVETRLFQELGLSAGAVRVVVHPGPDSLTLEQARMLARNALN